MAIAFERVIVMGAGSVATRCLEVMGRKGAPALSLAEYRVGAGITGLSADGRFQQELFCKRADAERYLLSITQKTLIISVNNQYIFPVSVCGKEYLQIVNCHSALLPKYPGIHAQTWAIYNNEAESGITWHFVDAGIDSGDIIAQAAVPITRDMTAITLMRRCFSMAVDILDDISGSLLAGQVPRIPQKRDENRRVYGYREYPNGGILDTGNMEHAYRILRSMDYGVARLMPPPRLIWSGVSYNVLGYRLAPAPEATTLLCCVDAGGTTAFLEEDGFRLTLKIERIF